MCKYFQPHSGVYSSIYTKEVLFCCRLLQIQAPLGASMLVCFWPMLSRNRLPCYVFDTLVTHANHVYNITDTDYWAGNGSTHCHVFTTFKGRFFNKQNQELNEKLLCLFCKFYSYWQGSWSFFDRFQFKGVVLIRSTEPYLICSSNLQPQFVHDGDEQLKKDYGTIGTKQMKK